MSATDRLPSIYRDSQNAISAAYQVGHEEGLEDGAHQERRTHHEWLLNSDERAAQAAREAAEYALLDAAKAWESEDDKTMKALAEEHYRVGGESMPAIWLRLRAEALFPKKAEATS